MVVLSNQVINKETIQQIKKKANSKEEKRERKVGKPKEIRKKIGSTCKRRETGRVEEGRRRGRRERGEEGVLISAQHGEGITLFVLLRRSK